MKTCYWEIGHHLERTLTYFPGIESFISSNNILNGHENNFIII